MGNVIALITTVLVAMFVFVLLSLLFIKVGWWLFVVPVFGLPELTWMQALGFSLLAGCFRSSTVSRKE